MNGYFVEFYIFVLFQKVGFIKWNQIVVFFSLFLFSISIKSTYKASSKMKKKQNQIRNKRRRRKKSEIISDNSTFAYSLRKNCFCFFGNVRYGQI